MSASFLLFDRFSVRLGGLLLAAALLSGCGSMGVNSGNVAMVRVVDASPDSPALDTYENNTPVAYNLEFSTATSYVPLAPGNHTLSATMAGSHQALVSSGATLGNGHQYTALIGNIAANLHETILQDQTQPAQSGRIEFRLLNQAARIGPVDVYLVPGSGKLTTTAPLVTNFSFGAGTGYLDVPEGTYAIAVVPARTVPASTTQTLLSDAQTSYASGAVRTVVLIDDHGTRAIPAAGVQAILLDDAD